jgi:hypothetical protein
MGRARKKTVLVNDPDKLPQPWLVDSEWLLNELARLREIILKIPVSNTSILPVNTAIDSIWRTESQLRYLLLLHREGQQAFAKKSDTPETEIALVQKQAVAR